MSGSERKNHNHIAWAAALGGAGSVFLMVGLSVHFTGEGESAVPVAITLLGGTLIMRGIYVATRG